MCRSQRLGGSAWGSASRAVSWGRISQAATTAPTRAMAPATSSASSNPAMNDSTGSRAFSWAAMIAPISAIPIEPPTWRQALRTADPTPALATGTERVAAAALGVIVIDMPNPPRTRPGRRFQKPASGPSWLK